MYNLSNKSTLLLCLQSINPFERTALEVFRKKVTTELTRTGQMRKANAFEEKANIGEKLDAIHAKVGYRIFFGNQSPFLLSLLLHHLQVDTLLKLSEEMKQDLSKGIGQIKTAVFSVSQRTCPTTICILPPKVYFLIAFLPFFPEPISSFFFSNRNPPKILVWIRVYRSW
jgi:hypothetical protein